MLLLMLTESSTTPAPNAVNSLPPAVLQLIGNLAAAAIGGGIAVFVAWLNARAKRQLEEPVATGDLYLRLINELQEEVSTIKQNRKEDSRYIDKLEERQRHWRHYVQALVEHIWAGKAPPPPSPPAELSSEPSREDPR